MFHSSKSRRASVATGSARLQVRAVGESLWEYIYYFRINVKREVGRKSRHHPGEGRLTPQRAPPATPVAAGPADSLESFEAK